MTRVNVGDIEVIETIFQCVNVHHAFADNPIRKNYFLAACCIFLREADPDIAYFNLTCPYGGRIGMGNSPLDTILKRSKVLRLHAILHDAAGYIRSYFNAGPGYCYVANHCPINSPLLGHVTGISFCLYLKLFHRRLFDKLVC